MDVNQKKYFKCKYCNSKFTLKRNLSKHFSIKHSGSDSVIKCFLCGQLFASQDLLDEHHQNFHEPSKYFEVRESALKRTVISYRYMYGNDTFLTPLEAQTDFIKNEIKKVLYFETGEKGIVKFSLIFIAELTMKDNSNNVIAKSIIPFRSKAYSAVPANKKQIKKNILNSMQEHLEKIDSFINNGSNWVFNRPIAIDIEVGRGNPIFTGANIKVGELNIKRLTNKKHLVNVPSKDNRCFLYCLVEHLFGNEIKNKKLEKSYAKYIKHFNIDGINFPVNIKDVKKFVKQNENLDIKINILYLSGKNVYPLECGIGEGSKKINLLSVPLDVCGKSTHHFLLITNIDKYLSKIYGKKEDGKPNYYEQAYYCANCFNKFSLKRLREKHEKMCSKQSGQIEKLPQKDKNDFIIFNKYENRFPQDLVAYLDFECELKKTGEICSSCTTIRCKCDMSYTRFETEQKPIVFSFVIINKEDEILCKKTFSGKNAGDYFLDYLLNEEDMWIKTYLNQNVAMRDLNDEELILYDSAETCYICEKIFTTDDVKVRDHDHTDGFFISAAHNSCNLKRKKQKELKIFMHNGSKYDFHFIVKSLAKKNVKNLYILPYNMENFRLVKFNSFVLVDSLSFLQSSLSQLSQELYDSGHDYPILKQSDIIKTNGYFDNDKFKMVLQKSFFPYEYW